MNSPAASAPIVLCIPGPWESRVDFIQRVITLKPEGIYMFAAGFLAHPSAGDHIAADYFGPDPSLAEAFHFAGQGKLEDKTVARIESHRGYAVLWFDGTVASEKQRLVKFTRVLKEIGGYAVKIDSCGVAHEWDEWFDLLNGSAFDLYRGFVSLTADENQFFSRGMHHFELADCAIPRNTPLEDAADVMNRFNFWRIQDHIDLRSGHTFSVTPESPHYRIMHSSDLRHDTDRDPCYNPAGVWNLSPA